jgi:hypothetical protein
MYTNLLLSNEVDKLNARIIVLEQKKDVDISGIDKRLLELEDKFQQWYIPITEIFK